MASPPVLTPTGTTGFNRQSWQDTVEAATYQKIMFADTIDEYPGKLLNLGNVRKYARAAASTLAQGDDGDGLTPVNIAGTPITVTPVGRFIQVEWSANEEAQIDFDLKNGGGNEIERGLAEAVDAAALANVASGTNIISAAAITATEWRQAVGRLGQNTNGMFAPGDGQIKGIFSFTQYPAIMAIDEFNHADVRGDGENPTVKGIFTKGGGINVRFSSVIFQDGNGWHNCVYVPSAFVIAWNQRTKSFFEQTELLFRMNVFNNHGSNVKHDARFVAVRTTASQLG